MITSENSYVHTDTLIEVDGPFELVPSSAPPPAARRRGKQPDVRALASFVDVTRRGGDTKENEDQPVQSAGVSQVQIAEATEKPLRGRGA